MKLLCFCCIVFLAAGIGLANVKMTQPAPQSIEPGKIILSTSLEVVPDYRVREARLQIAESTLNGLRANNGGVGPAAVAAVGFSSKRTIIAGLMMFLALSVAGVLLARKVGASYLSQTHKILLAVILFGGMMATAAIIARANAGPPPGFRWRNLPQALTQGQSTTGGVEIEVVPDDKMPGARFRLIIPVKNPNSGDE